MGYYHHNRGNSGCQWAKTLLFQVRWPQDSVERASVVDVSCWTPRSIYHVIFDMNCCIIFTYYYYFWLLQISSFTLALCYGVTCWVGKFVFLLNLATLLLCHCVLVTEVLVNIDRGKGVLPDGTKPLPEPMLTDHQWCPSDTHIRTISQEMPQPSIHRIRLKITYINFHSNFPGANEWRPQFRVYVQVGDRAVIAIN